MDWTGRERQESRRTLNPSRWEDRVAAYKCREDDSGCRGKRPAVLDAVHRRGDVEGARLDCGSGARPGLQMDTWDSPQDFGVKLPQSLLMCSQGRKPLEQVLCFKPGD